MTWNQARWIMGLRLAVCALVLSAAWPAAGATKTWNGAGATNNWSDDGLGGNWSDDPAPVTTVDDVLFNNGGADVAFGTITSVLDIAPMSLTGLVFANTTGDTHTVDLNGNTLTVLGNVDVNNDVIGQTTLAGFTDSVGGGMLNIGDGTQAITIGRRGTNTSGNMSGRLDLSAVETVNIDVATITMSDNATGQTSSTSATLNLGMTNTVLANTFYVGRRKGTATVDIVSGGTLNLGSNADRTDLLISYGDVNTSFNASGSFDMSAGVLVAFIDDLQIGVKTTGGSGGNSIGTMTLSSDAGNDVNVNNVVLGDWDATGGGLASGTITMLGGTFTVNNSVLRGDANGAGASDSIVNVSGGTMNIAADLMVDTVTVGNNGRTGLITVGGDAQIGSGSLFVGRRNSGAGAATNGTLDLSTAASTDINVGTLHIARQETSSDAVNGTLMLSTAGANTLTADTIRLGFIGGPNVGSTVGNLAFGGAANNVSVDTFIVGHDKATGHVTIAAGGVLTLGGKSGAEADLLIGDNASVNTGTNPTTSTFNLTGASASSVLTLDELIIGRYGSGGAGSGKGTLTMDAGTINANSVALAISTGSNPGNTVGTINLNSGTLNVVNDITNGAGTATLNVNGSAALTVGGNAGFDSVNIGVPGGNSGTLDTTGGAAFNLTANTLNLGITTSGSSAQGTLLLAADSSITATTITIGDSTSTGQESVQSRITLGSNTTAIAADTITIGGRKGNGLVAFDGSGTLNLGTVGDRIDNLYVGYNNFNITGTNAVGHLDGADGAINAFVDNMVLGQHLRSSGSLGSGSGTGRLTLVAGVFDVNTLLLGDAPHSTSTATGTVNLNGGTLRAGTIDHGAQAGNSIADFNFNGGRLAVDNFNFTLDQNGGILAPGDSPGSTLITGDYNLNVGSIEIELNGLTPIIEYDRVIVTGVATLASASVVDVLLGFSPGGSFYDVLIADEIVDNGLIVNLPGIGWSYAIINDFDGSNDVLRLSFVVPEPATLALLGPAMLMACRRRRA